MLFPAKINLTLPSWCSGKKATWHVDPALTKLITWDGLKGVSYIMFAQCRSSRALNALRDSADTTDAGRGFQSFMICTLNEFLRVRVVALGLSNFQGCPRVRPVVPSRREAQWNIRTSMGHLVNRYHVSPPATIVKQGQAKLAKSLGVGQSPDGVHHSRRSPLDSLH